MDGFPNDCDACDDDEFKSEEGICGCGVADTDCAYLYLGDIVDFDTQTELQTESKSTISPKYK
jgi:hypothetical protein